MIVRLSRDHVNGVAGLHGESLSGLLSELGSPLLRAYYDACTRTASAVGFVSLNSAAVAGFVLGSVDETRLKREIVCSRPLRIPLCVALGLIRRPSALINLLETFGRPAPDAHGPELTYLVVGDSFRRQGLGAELVNAFEAAMSARGVSTYQLSVDAVNTAAIEFYESLGLQCIAEYREFGGTRRRYQQNLSDRSDS